MQSDTNLIPWVFYPGAIPFIVALLFSIMWLDVLHTFKANKSAGGIWTQILFSTIELWSGRAKGKGKKMFVMNKNIKAQMESIWRFAYWNKKYFRGEISTFLYKTSVTNLLQFYLVKVTCNTFMTGFHAYNIPKHTFCCCVQFPSSLSQWPHIQSLSPTSALTLSFFDQVSGSVVIDHLLFF